MAEQRIKKSSQRVDGGWAWVICLGTHVCSVLSVGYTTSLGILFIEWKEYFDLSATTSSWLVSLPLLVASPLSLFVGVLTSRVGVRRVSMAGSAVNGLATILGSFATEVWQLYLSSAMSGLGIVMMFPPSLTILSDYFKKRFALANGLFVVGVAVGQMIFPPLLRLLIDNYGWKGAMLIVGAIQMNGVAVSAFFRPLQTKRDKVKHAESKLEGLDNDGATAITEMETAVPDTLLATRLQFHESDHQSRRENKSENEAQNASIISPSEVSLQEQTLNVVNSSSSSACGQNSQEENLGDKMRGNLEFMKPLTNYLVVLTLFVTGLFSMGINTNTIHLPSRAKEAGVSDDLSALILTIFAIFSILTRATHGWFVDKNYIGASTLMIIVMLGAGICCFLNPVSDSFAFLVGYSIILGSLLGVAAPLIFVIAISVASKPSQVPATLGLVLATFFLFSGTGSVIAGKIFDTSGNYVATFLASGAMFLVGSILTAVIKVCNTRSHKRSPEDEA